MGGRMAGRAVYRQVLGCCVCQKKTQHVRVPGMHVHVQEACTWEQMQQPPLCVL